MDKELVDQVARALHRQYSKEILGTPEKWEKITPTERSTWRLLARNTITLVQGYKPGSARKP